MNKVLRMNLVLLKDKLKPFCNDGFNYKDRKISKAGKIWVKENKEYYFDVEIENKKLYLKSTIRNGIL